MSELLTALTPDDLAELLKVNRRTIITHVSKQPGFPQSITGTRKPRWLAAEVQKFLKRKSVQSSHNAPKPA